MILDATTKKLQVVLAGAVTTNQLHLNVTWADTQNGATFVPGSASALTNGATPVDIVPAPAASTQRQVKELTAQNTDTVAATVTVQTVDGANTRSNIVVTIQSGETLFFAGGVWNVLGTNGALKTGNGVSSVALTVPARQTVTGSPITTAGTLAVTDNSQSANTVFAGPASGAAAGPTFRALAAADLNSLAFTTGSVLFGNASGGIGQDNAKIFWDDSNFRLGIGTATPDSILHVNSNTGAAIATVSSPGIHFMGADATTSALNIDTFGGSPNINLRRAQGTRASPTTITTPAATMGATVLQGWNGTAYYSTGLFRYEPTENFSLTGGGANLVFQTTATGTVVRGTKLTLFSDGRYGSVGALCDLSYSLQTPTTGFSITPSNITGNLILAPAGTLATGTVTMAAAPIDGQRFTLCSTQIITALTVSPNAGQTIVGAPTTLAVGGFASWIYLVSTSTWYRNG